MKQELAGSTIEAPPILPPELQLEFIADAAIAIEQSSRVNGVNGFNSFQAEGELLSKNLKRSEAYGTFKLIDVVEPWQIEREDDYVDRQSVVSAIATCAKAVLETDAAPQLYTLAAKSEAARDWLGIALSKDEELNDVFLQLAETLQDPIERLTASAVVIGANQGWFGDAGYGLEEPTEAVQTARQLAEQRREGRVVAATRLAPPDLMELCADKYSGGQVQPFKMKKLVSLANQGVAPAALREVSVRTGIDYLNLTENTVETITVAERLLQSSDPEVVAAVEAMGSSVHHSVSRVDDLFMLDKLVGNEKFQAVQLTAAQLVKAAEACTVTLRLLTRESPPDIMSLIGQATQSGETNSIAEAERLDKAERPIDQALIADELLSFVSQIDFVDAVRLAGDTEHLVRTAHDKKGTMDGHVISLARVPGFVAVATERVKASDGVLNRPIAPDVLSGSSYDLEKYKRLADIFDDQEIASLITDPTVGTLVLRDITRTVTDPFSNRSDVELTERILRTADVFGDIVVQDAIAEIQSRNELVASRISAEAMLAVPKDQAVELVSGLSRSNLEDLLDTTINQCVGDRITVGSAAALQAVLKHGLQDLTVEGAALHGVAPTLYNWLAADPVRSPISADEKASRISSEPVITLAMTPTLGEDLVGAYIGANASQAALETLMRPDIAGLSYMCSQQNWQLAVQKFAKDPEFAQEFFENLHSDVMTQLLEQTIPKTQDRMIRSMTSHLEVWQDIKLPVGVSRHRAVELLAKRLNPVLRPDPEDDKKTVEFYVDYPENALNMVHVLTARPEKLYGAEARQQEWSLLRLALEGDVSKMPQKISRIDEIFSDPLIRAAYSRVLELKQADPTISADQAWLGLTADMDDTERIRLASLEGGRQLGLRTADALASLKPIIQARKQWQQDSSRWFNQYVGQDIPADKLIKAWQDREAALAYGVADNPAAIGNWAKDNALLLYVHRKADEAGSSAVLKAEHLTQYPAVAKELSRVYSAELAYKGMEFYVQADLDKAAAEAVFKPFSASIIRPKLDAKRQPVINPETKQPVDREYVVEILDKRDPRGFTIGADTGCCMTIDGASESCIQAGYTDPNYAFLAVTIDGRVRAQSLLYINDDPNKEFEAVIVIDNIEANTGTDVREIREVYTQFLSGMVKSGQLPVPISAVHLGTGYSSVEIDDLPVAPVVVTPLPKTYTDAADQRLLAAFV